MTKRKRGKEDKENTHMLSVELIILPPARPLAAKWVGPIWDGDCW